MSSVKSEYKLLTVFYDGRCPLCQAEVLFLSRRSQPQILRFIDIHSSHYDASATGVSCEEAMAALYGQIEGEPIMQGVQVFSEAYLRANLPVLAWLFSRTWLRPLHNIAYRIFARNRHSISQLLGPLLLRIVQYGKH